MKSMKKLIPALCLLLISAVLMGTSTYAWFSMNTVVNATGMKVNATVPASLYIGTQNSTDAVIYSTVGTTETEIKNLQPTSTIDAVSWNKAAAKDPTQYIKTGNYEAIAEAELSNYVRKDIFYIRGEKAFTDLKVIDIKVTTVHDDVIDDALTVAVKCGSVVKFFSNENPAANRHGGVNGSQELITTLTFTEIQEAGLSEVIKSTETTTDTIVPVEVYIYYDGESSSCFTNAANGIGVDGCTVDISFSATFAS